MSQTALGATLTVLAGLALGGCGRTTLVEDSARRQILHIGNGAEPKTLDPGPQETEVEYILDSALFEGLVNIANDGETILPGVAQRWEISADGKNYTFHLRPDARWSDGTPLTAEDFVYAFRRVFTPSLGSPNNFYGYAILGARDMNEGRGTSLGVRAADAHTLLIQLGFRCPYLLYILGGAPFQPVPRAVVERFGGGARPGTAWCLPGNLVSNGPFQLSSWRPNQDVVVVANPFYWDRARVRLREIHFYPTEDAEAEERAFRSGQLHVTYQLPPSKIVSYRQRGDPALRLTPQLSTYYLLFNLTAAPFSDGRVRRALALALDRNRLVPIVGQGGFDPAHSLTRPGTDRYTPPPLADFDPGRARRLLADAGYPGGRGFPPTTLSLSSGLRSAFAEAIQESWRNELGLKIDLHAEEQKSFFDRLRTKDFQVGFMSFFYGVNAPETILVIGLSNSQWNWEGWKSPAFDQAYADASSAPDDTFRRRAFDRMEQLIFDEAPLSPVAFLNQPHLVSPMVKGWKDNAIYQIDWRELRLEPK